MILILTFILCVIPHLVQGQFGDVRCKCVCPALSPNSTNIKRVFSKSFHDSRDCKCEGVVDKEAQEGRPNLCDRCDCQWQRRNTMTIKFVVIFIICIVSILVLYMGFLICLDPLLPRRDVPYVEHKNEEARNFPKRGSVDQNQDSPSIQGPSNGVLWRMKNKVFGMRSHQERWKDTVQEQRRHIYDHHTMLN